MSSSLISDLDSTAGDPQPVISVAPVDLDSVGRPFPLQVRVSAPIEGGDLPVILFSHGNGWHHDGYAPLTSFWASRGLVVVQPTHLDSRRNAIGFDDPRFPSIWKQRIADLSLAIDQLDAVAAAVPGLADRIDPSRIAVVGHSWGAQSAQSLLGARVLEADGSVGEDFSDPRVSAGILLAATGTGGPHLHPFAQANFPFMYPSFDQLTTPTLVVAGDRDQSRMSSRGPDWFTDAFRLSPGATDLLTLVGAEHSLGGIPGYEVAETTDENPERVAVLQRLTTAYLRSALAVDASAWPTARAVIDASDGEFARVTSRSA